MVLYKSATVLTAVCLNSRDCMPTEKITIEHLFRDLFADDAALVAHTERALQRLILCFAKAAITSDAKIDREVDNRLAKASCAFGRLNKKVWDSKHLKKGTKISVYWNVVLTTLLCGFESWVTYHHHLRHLQHSHRRCLRTILIIYWSNYVTNAEVLDQAEITSIEVMLLKSHLH